MEVGRLNNIRIVLVGTTHPGNIGGAARSMRNMGLHNLYLVSPQSFPDQEATARASGADDVLASAVVTDSIQEAVKGCSLVLGTSARLRNLSLLLLEPHAAAQQVIAEANQHQVAIVFGRERTGLTNEELQYCQYHLHIPTVVDFSAMNLVAAVQVVCYEIFKAHNDLPVTATDKIDELATSDEMELFYKHLEKVIIASQFLNPKEPRRLMQRLRRLFNRARVEKNELNILRGILTSVERK